MNRLHTKFLVYALLLANVSYIMSMDEKPLTIGQVEARNKTAHFMEFLLKQNRITNPIYPIGNYDDAKKFAGHVVLYEITSKDKSRFSGDDLSQYGFIFERTHMYPSSFGYELNQFSNQGNPIGLRFDVNGKGRNNHPLLLSSACIFMRHLTPQEAADFCKKIKSRDIKCDESTRYSKAIVARLKYRAQQEADEAPSLDVITTKKNLEQLSSLTPEQAEEILKEVKKTDFFDYYVSNDEKNYIESLLQSIVEQTK
jgi:hypothetical protein